MKKTMRRGLSFGALVVCLLASGGNALAAAGDLSVASSSGVGSYTPGAAGTAIDADYVFTVTNNSGTALSDVVIDGDAFPSTDIVSWSWSCDDCTPSKSGTGSIDFTVNLAVDEVVTITATSVSYAASAISDPLTYQVAAFLDGETTATDSATDSKSRIPVGDLSVTSDSIATTYAPGDTVTDYQFTVSNPGPSDRVGIVIDGDARPTGMQSLSWECTPDTGSSCSTTSGSNTIDLTVDLQAGDSAVITAEVEYKRQATENPLEYTVAVAPASGDSDSGTNTDSATDSRNLSLVGDLSIVSNSVAQEYIPGDSAVTDYSYTITNNGPSDLEDIIVNGDAPLPDGMQSLIWSCTTTSGSQTPDSQCDISGPISGPIDLTVDLLSGTSATITATVEYKSSAIENTMDYTVTVAPASGDEDSSAGNDSATDSRELRREVDLSVTKSNGVNALNPQQAFTYTLTIDNTGPSDLGAIAGEKGGFIEDSIDDSKLQGHPDECQDSSPCWEICPEAGTVDSCPVDTVKGIGDINATSFESGFKLVAGSSTEAKVYVALKPNATGDVSNTASVSLAETTVTITDTDATNDSRTDTDSIEASTNISLVKDDGMLSAIPGTEHSYTVTVANEGFLGVSGITVIDSLPIFSGSDAGFTSGTISWRCEAEANACCNSGTNNCGTSSATAPVVTDELNADVDLSAQTSVTFTITGTIDPSATGTLSNTAEVPASGEYSAVSATDNNTVLHPSADLFISKTAAPAVENGNSFDLQYVISVKNLGPSFVAGAQVSDPLNSPSINNTTAQWTCSISGGSGNSQCGAATGVGVLNTTADLEPGSIATYVLDVSTEDFVSGIVENTATVSVSGTGVLDPVFNNNSASSAIVLTGTADLVITKSDGLSTVVPGESVTYTVQITNKGPDYVFGATVEDILPPQLGKAQWTCDAKTPIPGDLKHVVTEIRAIDLEGASAVVASPDGNHVYAVASHNGTLLAFEREVVPNANFGKLVLLEVEQDGVDDGADTGGIVEGLSDAADLVISPDGRNVYVVGPTDGKVAMFTRNTTAGTAGFGRLSFVGAVETQSNAVALALSPDGQHLYVSANDHLDVFERDAGVGTLVHLETLSGVDIPAGQQDLLLSPDGKYLYLSATGEVAVLLRNSDKDSLDFGKLVYESSNIHSDLADAKGLALSADGKHLYVTASDAAATTGALVLLSRDAGTGALTHVASYTDLDLTVPPAMYGGSLIGATDVFVAPDGEHVLVVAGVSKSLLVFRRTAATGLLSFEQDLVDQLPAAPAASVNGLDGVSSVQVTPDGRHILVAAAGDKAITVFERRAPDPLFSFIEVEQWNVDDPGDTAGVVPTLNGASSVSVSPDGAHVYAAGLGDHSLSVFARDPDKGIVEDTRGGHLDFIEAHINGQAGVSGIEKAGFVLVSPDGKYVYVSSVGFNSLAVFVRETDDDSPAFGRLTFLEAHFGLSGASGLVMDSSNRHLYVAASYEASVGIYQRETTGELTYLGKAQNGLDGMQGLEGAFSLDITASGKHLVVAGSEGDALVVLRRESDFAHPDFGLLTFVQAVQAGVGDRPRSVALSPEDSHVYVAAYNSDSVSVFRRDDDHTSASFGKLTLQAQYEEGVSGISGLNGARSLAVSPDGDRVYVGGEHDGTVVMFERNRNDTSSQFGALTFLEKRVDGNAGVTGLAGLRGVAVSPDSHHLYTAALSDNAVSAFVRGVGSSCTAVGAGDVLDVVDVGIGGVVTYTIEADVRPDALSGTLVNTATATVPVGFTDPNPTDNAATDTTDLTPEADLSISKTNARISSVAGEEINYQITVHNNGPSNAVDGLPSSIRVEDLLTANTDYVTDSISWTCEAVGSGMLSLVQTEKEGVGSVTGLHGASAVAVAMDPDGPTGPLGEYVYATGVLDDALVVFERNPVSGELNWLMAIANGDQLGSVTVQGLQGARDVVVSADGLYIYVASQVDDAIAIFSAGDNGAGQLQLNFLEFVTAAGLDQAAALALSTDNAYLYAVGSNDNAVVVFARDPLNGSLSFVEAQVDGVGNNQKLGGASDVLVTSDGSHVYVVAANSGAIAVFQRDAGSGGLSFLEYHDQASSGFDLSGASGVDISRDGKQLYVTAALSHSISVFTRNDDNTSGAFGSLTPLQQLSDDSGTLGLVGARDVLVSPDNFHVYVSSHTSDAIVFFNRDETDGSLTFVGAVSDDVGSIDGLNGVAGLAMSLDGRHLYSAATIDNAVDVFTRVADSSCPASGTGDINVAVNIAAGGSLLFSVDATISPTATGTLSNTAVVVAGIDGNADNDSSTDEDILDPEADLGITKTDGLAEYEGLKGATAIAISPADGGVHLYVAGGGESAIALLQRDSDHNSSDYGRLSFITGYRNGEDGVDGLSGIQDLVLSPDGLSLYAAGAIDNAVAVFKRSETDGQLTFLERQKQDELGVAGLSGASAVAVSPDGDHVYVSGRNTDSLAMFTRQNGDSSDPGFGRLDYVGSVQNGVDSVAGMAGPSDLVVSPDGKHLYLLGSSDNAVVLFERNPNSGSSAYGTLTFLAQYRDSDGFGGLINPEALEISDDGLFIYAAGKGDDAVVVMARNPADGSLSYVEHWKNGSGGATGLAGVSGLTLSPDAAHLYVAGSDDDAVSQFSRDAVTGQLVFDSVIQNDDPTAIPGEKVQGLGGAAALLVSPDNEHLYLAAATDDAVTGLDRDIASGELSYVETLINGLGGVAPGQKIDYSIVVSNNGPSDVLGAHVIDHFPSEFQSVSWICNPEGGAGCVPSGTGSIDERVNIPAGDRVIFTASGVIRSDVTGRLVNTASVQTPAGISDSAQSNNSATDDDTVLTQAADLFVLKDNGLSVVVPGESVTYSIVVGNNGPSYVSGAQVVDMVPEAITDVSWTCNATPEPGLLERVEAYSGHLDAYVDTAISPDGLFLYAVGSDAGIGRVVVYQRDTRAGNLKFVAAYSDNDAGLDGLSGAAAVILSPDGNTLYVAGETDDAIAVFAVDSVGGELSFVELQRDDINAVNGLGGVRGLVISPDGRHLYAAGFKDDGVAVFSLNGATGKLSFVQALLQGQGGADGLNGAIDLVFSPNGAHLYVAGKENDGLSVLERNAGDGSLTYLSTIQNWQITGEALSQPVSLLMHPQGDYLFVSGFAGDTVGVFERDSGNGELSYVSDIADGIDGVTSLNGPAGLAMSSDGVELYVAASLSNSISMLRFEGGNLSQQAVYDSTMISELAGVAQLSMSADDEHLYAGGETGSNLTALDRQLGSRCSSAGVGNLSDKVDISVAGQVVYTLTGRLLPGATGQLTNTASASLDASMQEVDGSNNLASDSDPIVGHADIGVSKTDGLTEVIAGASLSYQIQVAYQGGSNAVGATVSDPLPIFPDVSAGFVSGSAAMQCAGMPPLELRQQFAAADHADLAGSAWSVASSDGQFVYSSGSQNGKVMVWKRVMAGVDTGDLTLVQTVANGDALDGGTVSGLSGAAGVVLSPDEGHLYVVGDDDDSLLVFDRSAASGMLDWNNKYSNGQDNVAGMDGPVSVTLSPDGRFVYVASEMPGAVLDSGAIAVFQRDADTGALTFVDRVRDGFGTIAPEVNVMVDPRQIIISPDGKHLYVNGSSSDAIAHFNRDLSTGMLTFADVTRNGVAMVEGLGSVYSMVMSPNGTHVYATGMADDAVAVFSRNAETGILTFVETHKDGVNGVAGLDGSSALDLSPEGGYLYVAGMDSNAVSVFKRNWDTGALRYQFTRFNNTGSLSELLQPAGLLVAPDSATVYVLGHTPGSLVSFDVLPEGLCGTDVSAGDLLSWNLDLANRAGIALSVSATVHASARGVIANSALVSLPQGMVELELANNIGTDSDTRIMVQSDIAISKTGPTEAVIAGTDFEYVLQVSNAGPSDALGVMVVDNLPSMLNADWSCSATQGSSCSATGTGDLNDRVDVLVGGTLTYTIKVHPTSGGLADISNTASLVMEPGASDPDESNNSATVVTSFIEVADVRIRKTSLQSILVPGERVDYVLVVENDGPSDASVVRVIDNMPAVLSNVQWQCVATGAATCPMPATGTGNLDANAAVPVGDQVFFYLEGQLDPLFIKTEVSNTASIQMQGAGEDPDLTNNTATTSLGIQFEADLSIIKSDIEDPIWTQIPDSVVSYVLTVENKGPSMAWDVQLSDLWPSILTHPKITGCEDLAHAGGVINCDLGDMGPGVVTQVQMQGDLPDNEMGILTNEATVQSESHDDYPGNNYAAENTTLIRAGIADVVISKSNGVDVLVPGQDVAYTILVRNIGDADLPSVLVTDLMPDELLNVSWTCSATAGAVCASGGTDDIADNSAQLPVRGVLVYQVKAQVDSGLNPKNNIDVNNTVTVSYMGENGMLSASATDSDRLAEPVFMGGFE